VTQRHDQRPNAHQLNVYEGGRLGTGYASAQMGLRPATVTAWKAWSPDGPAPTGTNTYPEDR